MLHKPPNDRAAGVRELFATGVEEDEEDPGTAVEEVGPRIDSVGRKKRVYYDTALGVARADAFERQEYARGWRAVSCGGRRVSSPWTRRRLRRAIAFLELTLARAGRARGHDLVAQRELRRGGLLHHCTLYNALEENQLFTNQLSTIGFSAVPMF